MNNKNNVKWLETDHAKVMYCDDGYMFSTGDDYHGVEWVKVSKNFYDAFVLEFKRK